MKPILSRWQIRSLLSLLLIFWMDFAGGPKAWAETKPSLAVLPFMIEKVEDPGRGAICPVCKRVCRSGEILPGSQNTLTRLLYEKLETHGTFRILPFKKVEEVFSHWEKKPIEEKPVASSIQLGKELEANFLFVGYLFRFEERIGSRIGVERPASVGFDIHLFRLKDEKIVWEGRFNETQKPLTENLFKVGSFFRRKASWLTAEELASVGLDEMLRGLPGARELEEK